MVYTVTDKEQIEQLKKWWNDYGKSVAIAVSVGLLISMAWRYWQGHERVEEKVAADVYEQMLVSVSTKQYGLAEQYARQLQVKFAPTVYATLASLLWSSNDILNKNYGDAETQLQWVMDHSDNASFRQIARIRDARLLIEMKQYDKSMALLAKVDDKNFTPMIDAIKGTVYQAQGQLAQAKAAFQKAQQGYQLAGLNDPVLNLRI